MFLVHSALNNHAHSTDPVILPFVCVGLGLEGLQKWLDTDIVGCLQSFFIACPKGEWLKDPEVLFLEVTDTCGCTWVESAVCFCQD